MSHRLSLSFLLLLFSLSMSADIVTGRFVDAQTGQPLPDVVASVVEKTSMCSVRKGVSVDSLGRFSLPVTGDNCVLEGRLIGYYPVKRSFMAGVTNDTLSLGDIKLRPSEIFLKTVSVTAKTRRFTMCGDTVVFHPEAFNLEEGARLEELIRKLPGVTSKEGKLYWMDNPVRILMNGEELFADNSLLVNRLPAEAVESIKAYDQASELKKRTGRDDGKKDAVLDIQVKPGFLERWYGDAQVAYQTEDGYLAQLDAYYLSTRNPLMAFGNWENINRNYISKSFGGSGQGGEDPYGKQLFGALGYKHQWERKQGEKTLKNFATLSVNAGHDDGWGTEWENRETFFPGEERTFALRDVRRNTHGVRPTVNFYSSLKLDSVTNMQIYADWEYYRKDKEDVERSAVFASDPYEQSEEPLDAVFASGGLEDYGKSLITSSLYENSVQTKEQRTSASVELQHFFLDKSELTARAKFSYADGRRTERTARDIRYFCGEGETDWRDEQGRSPSHTLETGASAKYSKWLGRQVLLNLEYEFLHTDAFSKSDRFMSYLLPELLSPSAFVPDADNSFRHHSVENAHDVRLSGTVNLRSFTFMPLLKILRKRERLSYRRGELDLSEVRPDLYWLPSLTARWKLSRSSALEARYDYTLTDADEGVLRTVDYVDTTNPLFVTYGNSELADRFDHTAELKYIGNFVKHQQSVIAALRYGRSVTPIGSQYYYTPETGVYHMTWDNVRGGNTLGASLSYEQGIGDFVRVRNELAASFSESYGYLTATEPGMPLQLNRVRSFFVSEKPEVSYENDNLYAGLSASYERQRRANSLSYDYNKELTHYEAGLDARYKWKVFTVESSFKLSGYKGYAMASMNKVRPLWDMRVDWKILRNKGRLSLEFEDILNRENYFDVVVTATEREESRYEYIHHYVNLSFTYHFDAKKTEEGRRREKVRRSLDN